MPLIMLNISERLGGYKIINVAGKFTLAQSAYLLTKAYKIFTTDCGLMHLAISQNLHEHLVCFFGPTAPSHVLPANSPIHIYWSDADIYDKAYPLYGRLGSAQNYFSKLNIDEIIRQLQP